jgi:hypothetical protein
MLRSTFRLGLAVAIVAAAAIALTPAPVAATTPPSTDAHRCVTLGDDGMYMAKVCATIFFEQQEDDPDVDLVGEVKGYCQFSGTSTTVPCTGIRYYVSLFNGFSNLTPVRYACGSYDSAHTPCPSGTFVNDMDDDTGTGNPCKNNGFKDSFSSASQLSITMPDSMVEDPTYTITSLKILCSGVVDGS